MPPGNTTAVYKFVRRSTSHFRTLERCVGFFSDGPRQEQRFQSGRSQGNRSRSPSKGDNSTERQHARKTEKSPSGKEDRPPCFNNKKFEVMIESVLVGILRITDTSKINIKRERIVHSHVHKGRIDLPVLDEKEKGKEKKRPRQRKGNGRNCEYCTSQSEKYFRKAFSIRNFQERPLESKGKP